MKHTIDHDLDTATARKVADRAFSEYKARFPNYNPTADWVDDHRANISFSAKGIELKGGMEISDKAIAMELDVPFLLRPFQKKAIDVIDREVRLWIDKAHKGEI